MGVGSLWHLTIIFVFFQIRLIVLFYFYAKVLQNVQYMTRQDAHPHLSASISIFSIDQGLRDGISFHLFHFVLSHSKRKPAHLLLFHTLVRPSINTPAQSSICPSLHSPWTSGSKLKIFFDSDKNICHGSGLNTIESSKGSHPWFRWGRGVISNIVQLSWN